MLRSSLCHLHCYLHFDSEFEGGLGKLGLLTWQFRLASIWFYSILFYLSFMQLGGLDLERILAQLGRHQRIAGTSKQQRHMMGGIGKICELEGMDIHVCTGHTNHTSLNGAYRWTPLSSSWKWSLSDKSESIASILIVSVRNLIQSS